MKYVIEAESGRIYGPFKSAAKAAKWGEATLVRAANNRVNAYKIRPLYRPR